METLQTVFDDRLDNPQNTVMLDNVRAIVRAHGNRPLSDFRAEEEQETIHNVAMSTNGTEGSVSIDRGVQSICDNHAVQPEQLLDFARVAAVADMGSGTSDFLQLFKEGCETIAVDASQKHADIQKSRGHQAIHAEIPDLGGIDDRSIRLLNASWSLPFWAKNLEDSKSTLREYARVLEVGGIALVGPVTRSDVHVDWEYTIEALKYGKRETGPWHDGDRAFLSHTLSAFLSEALISTEQGSLDYGFLDVVCHRSPIDLNRGISSDYRGRVSPTNIPNYLMLRRAA